MNNNLTLSVTLTGDGRQLSGTLKTAQGDVREFGATTERESKKADTALTAPGRSAVTISENLREAGQEAQNFGSTTERESRKADTALTAPGRSAVTVSDHLREAGREAQNFGTTIEREGRKADASLTAPGRSATTVSEHLREIQREARAVGTETAQGSREANQALAQTGQEVQTTTNYFNTLRRAVGLALGAFSVRQLAGMADGWSDMQSVVGASIGDMSAAGDMMVRITDIANASYAPLQQTARTYASNVSSLRDLGRTADEAADYTESLNHMLVLTATRGQQAESVQNALSRAIAVGTLQTQGLETVLANGGEVAQALANQLGVTVSQLRGLATEGQITGDVIASALIGSLDDVRERAGEMPATIEDGFVRIGTSATRLVGELDQAMGVSEGIAGILIGAADMMSAAIDPLVDNIDNIQFAATAVAVVLAGRYVGALGVAITAKLAATQQTVAYQLALGRLAGISGTAAASQIALAGATRAAAGALALIGGPLGAAVIAGGAIYYFRNELNGTASQARSTAERVDDLTNAINTNSEAAVKAQLVSLTAQMFDLERQAISARAEVDRLTSGEGTSRRSGVLGIDTGQTGSQARAIEELGKISNEMDALGQSSDRLRSILAQLESSGVTPTVNSVRDLAAATTGSDKAAREAAAAAKQLTDATIAQAAAIEALRNRLVPHRSETVQLAQDQNTLNLAYAMGRITASEYLYMIGALQTAYIELGDKTDDVAEQISISVSTWTTVSENSIRRIDDAGSDLWLGLIDGSQNALDTVKRGFQQTLAEIAHMLTTQRLTVAVAGSLGFNTAGAGGVGGIGSSGGFGINPGGVGNAWRALQGGFNGIQWGGAGGAQAYGGGWANAATSGTGATGWMGGSMQNFSGMQGLAGAGAGFAGNYVGGQMFGQGKHSNTLGALGGLAGTYFGGPIGAFIGSGLGSALGGLFGGRSWNETGSGVSLGVSGGNITGNQFSEQHSKGGLFRSSRRRTQTSGLDSEFSGALQQVYDATEASLAATIEVLGFQSSALAGFTTGLTRIDTKGLNAEDAEAKIQEWLSNTLNALAIHSVGDVSQFAFGGETAIETVERLAVALGTLNPILEQLHGNTLAASLAGGDAASHLAELAGGLDAFSARADFYYQNILTEAERQERAMNAAAQAMGAFTARTGQVINSTDALRDLVDSIDLTTASGRELYNEAMNLAPALVEIERGLERIGQRFDQMLQDAESALADAEAQARRAYQVFDSQQFDMQIELLALMGDSESALALERERELASIDESLRPMRERIWAMQDEVTVQQNATTAARNYQRELSRVRDQLSQQFANIGNWLDQQQATSGSPETNLATAQEQLARQLVLAESGDRNALQNITQYAQQVLDANREYNASSAAGQRIQQDVYDAIAGLPAAINAEQFLADEIKAALREQTLGISTQLGDVLRGDNPSSIAANLAGYFTTLAGGIDGVLTRDQLAIVMSGKATDEQLTAIMRSVDLNGDGVISGLESVIIAGMPTDAVLGTVLRNKMSELDKNQLTHAQIRSALSPIASDAEIARLIREVDVNGDGMISQQELANQRLAGLAGGIGTTLAPMFDRIDLDASGLIDWNEFHSAFQGMASDDELRRIFDKLDADGSGTISRLEALNRSNEGTEANTDSMEKQARDQLRELNGLVSEMTRTTDQFVSLNTTMLSLRDAIIALGVAQDDIARIEEERAAAEQAERDRISNERTVSQYAAAASSHMAQSVDAIGRAQRGVDAVGMGSQEISEISKLIERYAGDDGLLQSSEYGALRDTIESMDPGHYRGVARTLALAARHASQAAFNERDAANVGVSGDDRVDAQGVNYWDLWQSHLRFAKGGVFTNSVVDEPTSFAMGLMGEAGPEAIMPLKRHSDGSLGVRAELPAFPQFSALNNSDIVETLRDLKREVQELRKENALLQAESNKHLAAANNQRGAVAKGQIGAIERGNRMLKKMEDEKRLEAAKR
ncbi:MULTISPECIES: tape measure protein [unclassified Halomonas]|uniref:tape measure protein n=1 Tax=unclassified Halomonas TaxID=2609666 RepID=UPI00099093EA|nr:MULTISPECIES: tape measure protein [unclassified Halomonas]AQU83253.1 hypothetical protein B2G49_12160 [Halomonas sp. 'Soap Lake \